MDGGNDFSGYQAQSEAVTKYFMDEYLDYLTSVRWDTITEAELLRGTNEILGRLSSRSIRLIGDAAETDPYAGQNAQTRETRLAEGLAAMEKSGGIISTRRGHDRPFYLPGPDSMPDRYERGLGAHMTEASRFIAREIMPGTTEGEISQGMANLRPVHQADVKRDEVNPAAVFQYGNEGVYYRARAERNSLGLPTGKVIVETQVTSGRSEEELREDRWERRAASPRSDGAGTRNIPFSAAREREAERARAEERNREEQRAMGQQRIDAITELLQMSGRGKENLINQYLRSGTISPEDAEKLRRGETP